MKTVMQGVREYAEGMEVRLEVREGRMIIVALNEAGYNQTSVDLEDLLTWIRQNKPELLKAKP